MGAAREMAKALGQNDVVQSLQQLTASAVTAAPEAAAAPALTNEKPLEECTVDELRAMVKTLQAGGGGGAAPKEEEKKEEGIDMAEVGKHIKQDDCWIVVNGMVLDC